MDDILLEAIVYRHGENDFELWELDIPQTAIDEIETILNKYRHRGCSVRGTGREIGLELEE